MNRKLAIISLLLFLPLVGIIWHEITGGFQMQKVRFDLPTEERWHCKMSQEEKNNVEEILSQPFYYYARGRQSYVFRSHDDKYVLKLFRYHLVKPRFGLHLYRYFPKLNAHRRYRIRAKREQFENWMKSYLIAFKDLKKEAGILCVHLTKTDDFTNSVTIYDRLGRSFSFDPNRTGFLLQKKTDLFLDKVKSLVKEKKKKELTSLLSSYLDMVISRHFKGINNKDPSWLRNIGSIGTEEVVEIDVGRYTYAPIVRDKKSLTSYLKRYVHSLEKYFSKEYPEMKEIFHEMTEKKVDFCGL